MHGFWCLLGLIVASGSLGGIIFSLDSPDSHKLSLPVIGDCNSGFFGHIVIGVGGAFVAIAASVPVLNLDLSLFDKVWTSLEDLKLLPLTLYIIGISVLGGYSGLRIISGLSHTMLKQLKKEIDEAKISSEEKITKLSGRIEENTQLDKKRSKEINKLKISLSRSEKERLLLRGAFLVETHDYLDAIAILDEYIATYPDEPKPLMWKARAQKRRKDIDGAISSTRKAIELRDDYWLYPYNLACYISLKNEGTAADIIDVLKKSLSLARGEEVDEFWEYADTDVDLDSLRKTEEFKEFKESSAHKPSQSG